jgi:hypothetical protein
MSDHDDFDEVFRDFRRFVGPVSGSNPADEGVLANLPQIEADDEPEVDDELILGIEDVTYLLFAADRQLGDFAVSAREDELEVKTSDFTVRKPLGVRVDPTGAQTAYRNGVLSVKLKRSEVRER